MTDQPSHPDRIRQLLQSKTVLSLEQLRHALADRVRSSLFRDLQKVELHTSYSHAALTQNPYELIEPRHPAEQKKVISQKP